MRHNQTAAAKHAPEAIAAGPTMLPAPPRWPSIASTSSHSCTRSRTTTKAVTSPSTELRLLAQCGGRQIHIVPYTCMPVAHTLLSLT